METKSRYAVIADLEQQKRSLIKEKDRLNDEIFEKNKEVKNLEYSKEQHESNFTRKESDLERETNQYEVEHKRKLENLEREKQDKLVDFGRRKYELSRGKEDTLKNHDISTERLKLETSNLQDTSARRSETIEEQIKSIDENLERFGKVVGTDKKSPSWKQNQKFDPHHGTTDFIAQSGKALSYKVGMSVQIRLKSPMLKNIEY